MPTVACSQSDVSTPEGTASWAKILGTDCVFQGRHRRCGLAAKMRSQMAVGGN